MHSPMKIGEGQSVRSPSQIQCTRTLVVVDHFGIGWENRSVVEYHSHHQEQRNVYSASTYLQTVQPQCMVCLLVGHLSM